MKKAQVFTIDVIVAFVILLVGIGILYYNYPYKNKSYYNAERLSDDIIGVLSETRITDICVNPGHDVADGCECPSYQKVQVIACNENIKNQDADLLTLFTELISNGYASDEDMYNAIHEIFVDKNVIDERRFGFAVIYTTPSSADPLELYNTER